MARRLIRIGLLLVLILGSLTLVERSSTLQCTTPVLTREELNAAIDTPVPPFVQNQITTPRLPVDDDIERRVHALLSQVVACSNAGEPLRVWSLYSPAYLSRLFRIQGPFSPELYAAYAQPLPYESGSGMTSESVEDVWRTTQGQYGLEAIMSYPSVPAPKRLLFWFAESSGGLRIEEVVGEISFSLP